jgi:hypothetical protein
MTKKTHHAPDYDKNNNEVCLNNLTQFFSGRTFTSEEIHKMVMFLITRHDRKSDLKIDVNFPVSQV